MQAQPLSETEDLLQTFVNASAQAPITYRHRMQLKRLSDAKGNLIYTFTVRPAEITSKVSRCVTDDVELDVNLDSLWRRQLSPYGLKAVTSAMNKLSLGNDEVLSERVVTDRKRLDLLQPIFSFFASVTASAPWSATHRPVLENLSYLDNSLGFTFNAVPRLSSNAVPRQNDGSQCEVSKAIDDLDMSQLQRLSEVFKLGEHERAAAREQLSRIPLAEGVYGLDLTVKVYPARTDEFGLEWDLAYAIGNLHNAVATAALGEGEDEGVDLELEIQRLIDGYQ